MIPAPELKRVVEEPRAAPNEWEGRDDSGARTEAAIPLHQWAESTAAELILPAVSGAERAAAPEEKRAAGLVESQSSGAGGCSPAEGAEMAGALVAAVHLATPAERASPKYDCRSESAPRAPRP